MKLLILCLFGVSLASNTAAQGTDGLAALVELIKTEVSNQVKTEIQSIKDGLLIEIREQINVKAIKEEIKNEIRRDMETQKQCRKDINSAREGNTVKPRKVLFLFYKK